MRRWLLVLLVALLPLRLWAGDAMATGMVTGAMEPVTEDRLVVPDSVANYQYFTGADTEFHSEYSAPQHDDCISVASAVTTECGDCQTVAPADHANCQNCTNCQTCNTVALAVTLLQQPPSAIATTAPTGRPLAFVNAVPDRGLKPPIV